MASQLNDLHHKEPLPTRQQSLVGEDDYVKPSAEFLSNLLLSNSSDHGAAGRQGKMKLDSSSFPVQIQDQIRTENTEGETVYWTCSTWVNPNGSTEKSSGKGIFMKMLGNVVFWALYVDGNLFEICNFTKNYYEV